jgi:hypothetical protein
MQCFNFGKTADLKISPWLLFFAPTVRDVRGMFRLRAICWPKPFRMKTQEFSATPQPG